MRFLLLTAVICCAVSTARADETLQQRYLAVYLKINDAEHLERAKDYAGALQDFRDCQTVLTQIHTSDPGWESALVGHRIEDCQTKILDLEQKVAPAAQASSTNQLQPSEIVAANTAANPAGIPILPPHPRVSYPWKSGIVTTLFWIGEDASKASAWNENWTKTNSGADAPDDRNGFAAAGHASLVSPFYVALPFNDLAYPKKAKDWVPRSWHQPDKAGKHVSACKDRWVCVKNANGRICYAQWEDVGPFGNDHAEYVFGQERPADGHPGLDVSPAVAQYLGIDGGDKKVVTSWRFVDDQDVPPGQWLKYDEQALIFTALHQQQKP